MSTLSGKKSTIVTEYIKNLIRDKKLPSDGRLPSENSLTKELGVSRVTVRRALAELCEKGIIYTEHGRGSFASDYSQSGDSTVLIPFIISNGESSSRFLDIYSGTQNFFLSKNMQIILSVSNHNPEQEKNSIMQFKNSGYNHMIVIPNGINDNSTFYYDLIRNGTNFVFVDQKPPIFPYNYVHSDNFFGGFTITNHLIEYGHKRIAFIYYEAPQNSSSTNDRIAGYRFSLKKNNIAYDSNLVCYTDDLLCEQTLEQLLSLPEPPTAIFAVNDTLAIYISNLLSKRGISVPDDISLAGYDNLPFSETYSPAITTINQNFYNLGYKAAELMYNIIKNPTNVITDCSIPVELVLRDSVKKL